MSNNSIFIRYVTFDDANCILDWENNEENWAVSENDSPYSLFDIISLISELQNVQKSKQGRWMICTTVGENVIGCVDLTEIDFEKNTAEVGILIADKNQRRKGYALKALHLIEGKATELGIKKLSCSVHATNSSSIDLFKKLEYIKLENVSKEIYFFEKWLKK